MSYKTILVHLNDENRLAGLLDAAVGLARTTDAHLIGVNVLPPVIVIGGMEGGAGGIVEEHRDAYREQIGRIRKTFEESTRVPGVSAEFRQLDADYADAGDALIEHARCADLVVVNQAAPDWAYSNMLDLGERMVLESGRPVLMVPNLHKPGPLGKRVLVGWNSRREATRAVFDALPILQAADDVAIVWINPQNELRTAGDLPGTEICSTLARHKVRCESIRTIEPATDVGAALLSTAQSNDADMIVMGCYGHSRLREFVFGGASRHVLQHMQVPVLLSH
ncbi:MAG: universal stress protein [Hyphomicrobiaceae bacterium]